MEHLEARSPFRHDDGRASDVDGNP
jgi:hypothetical protein